MSFQPVSRVTKSTFLFLILSLMLILVLTACGRLTGDMGFGGGEEPGLGEGEDLGEEGFEPLDISVEADQPGEKGDVPPVGISCPAEAMEINMFMHHTWNFAPNRQTDKMSVEGRTGPLADCSLVVHRDKVSMEDCVIPFENNGYIESDQGRCEITANGFAVISLEEGFCKGGVITLSISENLDPDEGYGGSMNCPGFSRPYIPFYPPSLTTREFHIQVGGMSATETVDPDLSGQFRYSKEWTMVSEDLELPEE